MRCDWIAVDWGTSNLRCWAVDKDGRSEAFAESDRGMARLDAYEFESALLELINEWLPASGAVEIVICGMAGARGGWIEAPYRSAPCAPMSAEMAMSPVTRDQRLHVTIVPGIKTARPKHDVMRGEEVQIAGYLADYPLDNGVLCLPGTHTKWVHVKNNEIISFRTFMSGELFDLISRHSVLRRCIDTSQWNNGEFEQSVDRIFSRPEFLAGDLFSIRAESLLGELPPDLTAARLSGLLVGAELAASKNYWFGHTPIILGAERTAQLYQSALAKLGIEARLFNASASTLRGLAKFRQLQGNTP
ncbi:MAG: 2-dehydro-3-deoxygalactonokinase [Rhodobacteraceae bacterium]|nr:2-dehydro-3-deoxygalactonokinase [Paracoccaceae bacterium]